MTKKTSGILNDSGSAVLLYVIVISLIVVGIFTSTMLMNQNAEKQIYQARFRNQLDTFETRWQTLLSQPGTYINCKFDTPNSCQLNPDILKQYQSQSMIGGGCAKSKEQQSAASQSRDGASSGGTSLPTCHLTCGFCASVTLNGSVASLTVNPVGTYLRPLVAQIQIPYDILQQQTISCPLIDPTKPRFAGIDAKGNAICLPLQSPKCQYPGVQFAVGISPGTGAIICRNIPNLKITCPDDSFISGFGWTTKNIGRACAVRKWPYVFNYYPDKPVAVNPTPVPATSTPSPSVTATPAQCVAHYIDPSGNAVYDDSAVARCDENGKPKVGGANMCPGWGVDDCGASHTTASSGSTGSSSSGDGGGVGGKDNGGAGGGASHGGSYGSTTGAGTGAGAGNSGGSSGGDD